MCVLEVNPIWLFQGWCSLFEIKETDKWYLTPIYFSASLYLLYTLFIGNVVTSYFANSYYFIAIIFIFITVIVMCYQ